jgi:hypothetical protein
MRPHCDVVSAADIEPAAVELAENPAPVEGTENQGDADAEPTSPARREKEKTK